MSSRDDGDNRPSTSTSSDGDGGAAGSSGVGRMSGDGEKKTCSLCGKTLTSKYSLDRHVRRVHALSHAHKCPICGGCFTGRRALGHHMNRFHGEGDGGYGGDGIGEDKGDNGDFVGPGERYDFADNAWDGPGDVEEGDEMGRLLTRYWSSIRSKLHTRPLQDVLNVRLWGRGGGGEGEDVWERLEAAWNRCRTASKLNCSAGLILEHKTSGELRYFHSSSNNATFFPGPKLVRSAEHLRDFFADVQALDLREESARRRPNTAWVIRSITNFTFYIYKLLDVGKVGGAVSKLPHFILNNRHVLALDVDHHRTRGGSRLITDKLCFFRCLAALRDCRCSGGCGCKCRRVSEMTTKRLFLRYKTYRSLSFTTKDFPGVDAYDLLTLEECFDVAITVFCLSEGGGSSIVWNSGSKHKADKLYLNLYNNHFSWIKDVNAFAKSFTCRACDAAFTRHSSLKRHSCPSEKVSRFVFPGGSFTAPPTVFTKLKHEANIDVTDPNLLFYPYYITYDIECFMPRENLPEATPTLEFSARHELLSISACSNVPGFEQPVCFVRESTEKASKCVNNFVEYLVDVSDAAGALISTRFEHVRVKLRKFLEDREEREKPFEGAGFSNTAHYAKNFRLRSLESELEQHISSVPVVGFNSQKYDLNILKSLLLRAIQEVEGEDFVFIVKRVNSMSCVESRRFRFLDICNFIAPGFNYAKYLKAFGVEERKGFFPYDWVDSLEKLNTTNLPSRDCFFNTLTQKEMDPADYRYCQKVWEEEEMETFKDFLVWYNNLDVAPFITAIERQSSVYRQKGIDMLKSAISLPGLAIRWLFTEVEVDPYAFSAHAHDDCTRRLMALSGELRSSQPVQLFDEESKSLYFSLRDNVVGGPSIIFHRYHEVGVTRIRTSRYGHEAKACGSVLGVDANALYLYCMMGDMPTGYPRRRLESNNFALEPVKKFSKAAHGWLEYISWKSGEAIQHQHRGGEIRLGLHNLPVDGYAEASRTVYQFHGCYWHGHSCARAERKRVKDEKDDNHPTRNTPRSEIYAETKAKEEYIRSLGYALVSIWECEWDDRMRKDVEVKTFLSIFYQTLYPDKKSVSAEQIVSRVRSGEYYGLIECDISVPEALRDKFSEMSPIFKNVQVGREHLSEHMRNFAEAEGFLKRPQRMLVGSLFGERVMLITDLAKWYLEQGLVITRVYQFVHYTPRRVYKKFGSSVSDARRDGDANPDLALLASTSKLIGNSAYGKTITNKERHRSVKYVESAVEASVKVRSAHFSSLNEIDDDYYEIEMRKLKIRMDIPSIVGFVILQVAKLRMLEFYYDFMDKFVSRSDFEYVEMDTDSAYMALSAGSIEDVIRPEMRERFYEEYGEWFPRPYCEEHKSAFVKTRLEDRMWKGEDCCEKVHRYDTRTPGLFKEEFKGRGVVALNSKTYFCWSEDGDCKYSSKGLNKRGNQLTKETFLSVLKTRETFRGSNRGFVIKDNQTFTYSQLKSGLTYFYAKRKVGEDGVSTSTIDC